MIAIEEMVKIGVDIGGTFTDFIAFDRVEVRIHKVLSTPQNPAEAVLRGLSEVVGADEAKEVVHGSTVATNALLERKGAKTALITTEGFEDVLEIGRQIRPQIYNLFVEKPAPLVPASRRFGIPERTLPTGEILKPAKEMAIREVLRRIEDQGAESVAICLLFSYANPKNENRVQGLAQELGLPISTSHRILPEYREYERCSTTVVNAYISPIVDGYLSLLEEKIDGSLQMMQSNGGRISAWKIREEPVRTIFSGPAGGVIGATWMARLAGYENIITFDMGGTSTDVSLCYGDIKTTTETVIGGCPIKVPIIDIHTVGAGGGSIAYLDEGGALRVGPRSAGADPGPLCYGRGDQLTVTDAHLFLGRLDPDHFLGGRMELDPERVEAYMERFAKACGLEPLRVAEGVLEVANATMEKAIRVISVGRGYDPREFILVSFGGAGGLHACDLARAMSIPTVLVPKNPGVLSALGMQLADIIKDYSQTILVRSDEISYQEIVELFRPLEDRGLSEILAEGAEESEIVLDRFVDMRYVGQSYEITVPFDLHFTRAFHRLHHRIYGHFDERKPTEIVNLRLKAVGRCPKPGIRKEKPTDEDSSSAILGIKKASFSGSLHESTLYDRSKLKPGNRFQGPALVVELSATTVVPPDFACRVDGFENLILERV